jgi:adenosylmethionine-8-amino-7-oxononanoate aminotransferase
LTALAPGSLEHVFFSDSGSVAVEVAMKMAVQYWLNRGTPGRTRFVAFRDGYHGDTMGAMSVCDPEAGMHTSLRAYLPAQIFAELPRTPQELTALDSLLAAPAHEIAAVIVEPLVQGAGGMRFHTPAELAQIAAAARRHDLLLIADEIFTGFGRTGTMFACEQADVAPDILCVSKALTGGTMGLAATLASRTVFEAFLSDEAGAALMHGPTFMANPLACAAANASLDLFEREPRLGQAAAIGAQLRDGLEACRQLADVRDVRALGAIGVVQLRRPPARLEALRRRFVDHGVWIRPFGDVVYLMPPLVVAPPDLRALLDAIPVVLEEASKASEL